MKNELSIIHIPYVVTLRNGAPTKIDGSKILILSLMSIHHS